MSFLKRLFGFLAKPEPISRPAGASTATPAKALIVESSPPKTVAISWQELIDSRSRIAGYLLRASSLQAGNTPGGDELLAALQEERVLQLAERRLAVIPLTPAQWRQADFSRLAGPNVVFVLEVGAGDAAILADVLADMRARGMRAGLSEQGLHSAGVAPTLGELLLINVQGVPLQALEARIRALRQQAPSLQLLVDGLSAWSEHRLFQSLGAHYSAGSFTSQPDDSDSQGQVSQSRLVVIEMLNQLRGHAELSDIAATAKRDPAVVVKLLEMANSPMSGLSRQVVTLEDAIMLLGREALYRWLALAMFRIGGNQNGRDETLLVIALCRACFLESLAVQDRQMSGELFLVGLLSVMDALLGVPMAQVIGKMRLPDAVAGALLESIGPYARYLSLAMSMERCRMAQAVMLASSLGIDTNNLLNAYSDAMGVATAELTEQS